MTKNRSMKIAVLVLALALLTSCFVGSTFAKYSSKGTGSAEATVALWSFKVGDTDIATTNSFEFSLFQQGYADTGVNGTKLAPGTTGNFSFAFKNESEVNASYTFDLNADESELNNVPLEFTTTPEDDDSWKSINDFAAVTNNLAYGGAEGSVIVHWRWVFGDASQDDTNLGKTQPDVTIVVDVTAEQKDN